MSSYHSSFSYLNKNSSKDMHWLVVHFEADQGETDSHLSQDQVYTNSHNGARRILYGTKWNAVANVKITVIKQNHSDFTEDECRNAYKWLTGKPTASYLDLYAGDVLRYSFLGTVQDVKPQKLDARTVGLNIYFESISPWAYSPVQIHTPESSESQLLSIDNSNGIGALYHLQDDYFFKVNSDGVVYVVSDDINVSSTRVMYIGDSTSLTIFNSTDDLYTPVYLNMVFSNSNGEDLVIRNETTGEETHISKLGSNEVITIKSNQLIISDKNRIFGNDFNFVWPRLIPGENVFKIECNGSLVFSYRYPIKIGDCAIDVYVSDNNDCGCPDNTDYGFMPWNYITETPTTVAGYGITDVYTEFEIDNKLESLNIKDTSINESELNEMLNDVLD